MLLFVLSSIFLLFSQTSPVKGYFWRDYNGTIPLEALPLGFGPSKEPIYIGHAYVSGSGVIHGQIEPGVASIKTLLNFAPESSDYVQILCGHSSNFRFGRTSSQNFQNFLATHKVVRGGFQERDINLYVGRVKKNGVTRVTKINSVNNMMYDFADSSNLLKMDHQGDFDVLYKIPSATARSDDSWDMSFQLDDEIKIMTNF